MDPVESRGGVPIADAAAHLGVTIELLRKRAQRKTIPAYKVDGRWYVMLDTVQDVQDEVPGHGQDRTSSPGHGGTSSLTVSPAAMSQLEAIRDQWLQPLVDQLRAVERENGRLEAERDAIAAERDRLAEELSRDHTMADDLAGLLERERDTLRQEVERLRAGAEAPVAAPEAPGHAERPDAGVGEGPWWRRWLRR